MTTRERNIIKEIYPKACAGSRHAITVLQNLTTKKRSSKKCKNCGERMFRFKGQAEKVYCTQLCHQIFRRTQGLMKTLISFLLLVALNVSAGGLVISWVNDVANPIGTQTIVSYGIAPNNYTNSFLVAYGVSTVTVSNLPPGVRFYVAVKATDGVDSSVYSNEDNAKTKLNPPKNTTATP